MTYEPDPKRPPRDPHDGLVRGRWKNACSGTANICYGFVFEPDPNGPEWGQPPNDPPPPGAPNIQFEWTDELDVYLPNQIRIATPQQLQKMRAEFWFNEQRAGGDPWIGPSEEWQRRRLLVEAELRKRGLSVEPVER